MSSRSIDVSEELRLILIVSDILLHLVFFMYFLCNVGFMCMCIYFRLIFLTDGLEGGLEVWTLLWIVIITDYCVKYCTIIVKALLTLIPKSLLSYQLKVGDSLPPPLPLFVYRGTQSNCDELRILC